METHSSILAGRIPRTEDPGGLQSTGSPRTGHDCSDLARSHGRPRQPPSLLAGRNKGLLLE